MVDSRIARFLATVLVGAFAAFAVASLVAPPDPFTQLFLAAPLLLVVLPLSYYLVYRGGWDAVAARLGR